MKKLISILLASMLFLTMISPVMADEMSLVEINNAMLNGNTIVGELTIYAWDGSGAGSSGGSGTGHVFLSFKNTYSTPLDVGVYCVGQNAEITIGTWPGSLHGGIYYNLESLLYYVNGTISNTVSLTIEITANQLITINGIIEDSNSYDLITNNCMDFALRIWNAVSTQQLSTGGMINMPIALYYLMMDLSNRQINKTIVNNTNVGYIMDNYTWHALTAQEKAQLTNQFQNVDDSEIMMEDPLHEGS
jgi:hypothetical protein